MTEIYAKRPGLINRLGSLCFGRRLSVKQHGKQQAMENLFKKNLSFIYNLCSLCFGRGLAVKREVSDFMGHGIEIHKQRAVDIDILSLGQILMQTSGYVQKETQQLSSANQTEEMEIDDMLELNYPNCDENRNTKKRSNEEHASDDDIKDKDYNPENNVTPKKNRITYKKTRRTPQRQSIRRVLRYLLILKLFFPFTNVKIFHKYVVFCIFVVYLK